jgi:hypothetical protein
MEADEERSDNVEYAYAYILNKRKETEDIKDEYDLVDSGIITHVKYFPRTGFNPCPGCKRTFSIEVLCCMNCGYGII